MPPHNHRFLIKFYARFSFLHLTCSFLLLIQPETEYHTDNTERPGHQNPVEDNRPGDCEYLAAYTKTWPSALYSMAGHHRVGKTGYGYKYPAPAKHAIF